MNDDLLFIPANYLIVRKPASVWISLALNALSLAENPVSAPEKRLNRSLRVARVLLCNNVVCQFGRCLRRKNFFDTTPIG